ncbi:ATP-binding cassette domain-containing protein [Saccharopolyspora elongata]|uniref:ABC-F family ATP-binding cassette domain-containing protein n=1 Tax=Saccharopolyspora elongata TaxID=2530387 RepID=A0A4R4Z7M1_9PSEU|nr:ATP-binding cassette domain-containing protein [Saccharopolyspora elongata]TDD53144.1 ABC-F family ATP-binding cassette domain-containing protein [Saccharopolyspora elongata]
MSTRIVLPARARTHLSAAEIHLARGGRAVLTGVDLAVSPGDRLGVVGGNGAGKTTLLQVLAGNLVPDSGTVHRVGTFGVADQEIPVDDGRTVGDLIDIELADARRALQEFEAATAALVEERPGADEQYAEALAAAESLNAWDADRRVDISLAALGAVADRARPLAALSVGQRYRVRLACLLGAEHDLLLLDEPTNHLDAAGLEHLTTRLREHPGGVVLVSHDRALLADVVTSVLDLDPTRDGCPRTYGGGYAGYQQGKRAERERWENEYRAQQREHQRLADDLSAAQDRLSTGWRPEKGTGKHTRATRAPALVRAVHRRQEDLDAHRVDVPAPPLRFQAPELGDMPGVPLLHAEEVTLRGRLEQPRSLLLRSGDRLVVTGRNGAGKSSLLSVLAGELQPTSGAVVRNAAARVSWLAQESPAAARLTTAGEAYQRAVDELAVSGLIDDDAIPLPELGLLPDAAAGRPVAELSIGQQRRLQLAIALAARPHVLLLDEPTNHLSMTLVEELTDALTTTTAAIVVATHDRQLLRDTANWPRLPL